VSTESFRLTYRDCRELFARRLAEPPTRIQLLGGPRQVGKTTLLLELAEELGARALYAAGDTPEAYLPGFWERLWARAEEIARTDGGCVVLLDEIHFLENWAGRLKGQWDRLRRRKTRVHVIATGSSALHLGSGSRESLAGRFERVTLAHWTAAALRDAFRIKADEAAETIVRQGSYPGAFDLRGDPPRWAAYVRDAILEPAIGRDLLALAPVRKPALLRQVFGVCASSPAQIVSLQKLQGQLQDPGALETIAHYLSLLEEAFLVAPLEKHSTRTTRRRASPPKVVTLNNALLAVSDPRGVPDPATDQARFGEWLENACLAYAWNAGQRVTYWREEPYEIDAVVEGSWGRWAIEVKSGQVEENALRSLGEFTRRFPGYRPLVICDARVRTRVERAGIEAVDWREFLLHGPARAGRS
jgi:predicted AAA+ superfamily ATPase